MKNNDDTVYVNSLEISDITRSIIPDGYNSMLISVISSGFDGYVADLIAPLELCSYDYTKGNVYDMMLTDLMPNANSLNHINDDYKARLDEAIIIDYNIGLTRKPILHLYVSMPILFNLSHKEIYDIVYRTVKFQFKEIHRLSEDKASRVSNILACKASKHIYNHRDVVTDIDVTINISNGIEVLYTLMVTRV